MSIAFIVYSSTQFILREYGATTLFVDGVDNVVTQAFQMNGGGGAFVTILIFSHYIMERITLCQTGSDK